MADPITTLAAIFGTTGAAAGTAGTAAAATAGAAAGAALPVATVAAAAPAAGILGSGITWGQLIGTGAAAAGTIYSGLRGKANADFEAKQMRKKADDELAIGQRNATQARREKESLLSKARATAAGSGTDVSDPGIVSIMSGIEQQGEYNALSAMYNAELAKTGLYAQAKQRKSEGTGDFIGSLFDAGSTIYAGLKKPRYGYG